MIKRILLGIIFPLQLFAQMEMWVARYDGTKGYDAAYSMTLDDSGYVYVTGSSIDTYNGVLYYATIKYDNSGDTVWTRRYSGPDTINNDAYAIAVDKNGNVYVTGRSVSSGTGYDYATVKYNNIGDEMWVRRYNYSSSSTRNTDYTYAIAVDNNGNVYVTGRSDDSATKGDYATVKYDSLGNTMWVRRYDGSDSGGDAAYALAIDNVGNTYVTGVSRGLTYIDYATIKYDSLGDTVWIRRYSGSKKSYCEGMNYYKQDNEKGSIRNGGATAIAVDISGNVYVTGCVTTGVYPNTDYATIKYNSAGDELWARRYHGPDSTGEDEATALAIDNSGNVYVTGKSYSATSYDYATIKYDSSGDTVWIRRYDGPGHTYDWGTAIAVDDNGNVYVTGRSCDTGTVYPDYTTIKYGSSGNEEWIQRYDGPVNLLDCAYAIALDNKGYVYVTGGSDGYYNIDYTTIKYACVGIEEQGTHQKDGGQAVNSKQLSVKAFPNPFVNTTGIRLADSKIGRLENLKIKVYDISGKLVEETDKTIIGKNLKPGIYFIKTNNSHFLKLIKLGELK